jgi:hypothetical protein
MIRILAAAGLAFATLACGSTLGEVDSQAGAGGHVTPTPSAAPTVGRPVGAPVQGWHRITNDRGGWSIDIPDGWHDRPEQPPLGHSIGSAQPDGLVFPPPKTGMSLGLRVLMNYDGSDLRTFARGNVWIATCAACTQVLESARLVLGGQDAEFYSVSQNQPRPLDELEPRLYWLVRSPFLADRVVVITATPAASPLRPTAERIVSTLQFYRPAPPDLTPTKTRQQVIASFMQNGWTITRIEAKLLRFQDWERAFNDSLRAAANGGPTMIRSTMTDPDTMVWVVAFTGSGFTPPKAYGPGPGSIGPPGVGPSSPTATPIPLWSWAINVVPAREPYGWGCPCFGGPEKTWPVWFDQLADRDR